MATKEAGRIRIGISGWTYRPWRGVFYPSSLVQKRELAYAASIFDSIEINGTFYSMQLPSSFARWRDATPDDFVFALKGPRYVTHLLRLKRIEQPLANFFASGPLRLGPKLGPILWQFPPNFEFNLELFEHFLEILPRSAPAAASLAAKCDARLQDRRYLHAEGDWEIRHAVEIRHASFVSPRFVALLRRHKVALVCADSVEWPKLVDVTAPFVYCRLHGSKELYASGYDGPELDTWASWVTRWAAGGEIEEGQHAAQTAAPRRKSRDVYVYFDNDAKVRAPIDAQGLQSRVKSLMSI